MAWSYRKAADWAIRTRIFWGCALAGNVDENTYRAWNEGLAQELFISEAAGAHPSRYTSPRK
jgi:hypothetical protein